jgi:hypothetical protein
MLFDTGSTKTLIFDTRCSVPNCSTDKAKFDTTMSSTFQRTSIAARNGYSTGQTYWGEWVKDIVSLGGRSVCNYTFQAIDPSDVHDDSLWGSGILGASWTYAAGDIGSSLLRTIVDGMEDKRFGLYLSRLDSDSDSDITRPRSELTLGYVPTACLANPSGAATSKYDGELHTTAIYLDPGGKPRGWWIPLDGLVFGNKTIAIPPASQALVDSGTPTIDMPVEFVREFYSGIAGAVEDDGVWTFPCDSPGINLTVTVGGHEFPIYWGDLARPLYEGAAVCRGAVEENVAEGGDPDG